MKEDSIEEQKIQQAKNNILRGEDIDSATYILEKVIFDNVFFIGGRVNPLKVATRQVINFIKRYQKSDYETICLENNELKEKIAVIPMKMIEYNEEERIATYKAKIELTTGGDYGYTFRVMPKHEMLLDSENLNLVKWIVK